MGTSQEWPHPVCLNELALCLPRPARPLPDPLQGPVCPQATSPLTPSSAHPTGRGWGAGGCTMVVSTSSPSLPPQPGSLRLQNVYALLLAHTHHRLPPHPWAPPVFSGGSYSSSLRRFFESEMRANPGKGTPSFRAPS